jgi:hypothetical protein
MDAAQEKFVHGQKQSAWAEAFSVGCNCRRWFAPVPGRLRAA